MNLRDLTLQAAVLKVLADKVAARLAAVKAAAEQEFAETGSTQAVPQLPDGTKVATVSYAGGDAKSASVTDERAFLAWVLEHYPDEITAVVRDGARKKLLDGCKQAGRPLDPATGEIIPGVTVKDSRPYVSIRFKPGGADAVADAWLAGDLQGIAVVRPRAVEAGEAA